MTAIWYRHWLEMRSAIYVIAVVAVAVVLIYAFAVYGIGTYLAESGNLSKEVRDLAPLAPNLPASLVVPWGVHVRALGFLVVALPVLATCRERYGNHMTGPFTPRHPSVTFTMSLPVSRTWLTATRVGAACAVAFIVVIALLIAHAGVLVTIGQPVPFWPMAASSVRAVALMFVLLVLFAAFVTGLREFWAGVAIAATMLANLMLWGTQVAHFIAGAPWSHVGLATSTAVALCAVSILLARLKEY